jgi:hypothetical protein
VDFDFLFLDSLEILIAPSKKEPQIPSAQKKPPTARHKKTQKKRTRARA